MGAKRKACCAWALHDRMHDVTRELAACPAWEVKKEALSVARPLTAADVGGALRWTDYYLFVSSHARKETCSHLAARRASAHMAN